MLLLSVNRSKKNGRKYRYRNRNMAVSTVFSYLMTICALTVHVKGELTLSSETEKLVQQAEKEVRSLRYSIAETNSDDVAHLTRLTTPELISQYGYPCESHSFTTEDGYILTMHRIPRGKNESETTGNDGRRAVFLQHGLFASSADFCMNGDSSLALLLANKGYDIWLGNCRGNTYSNKHMTLDSESSEFWDFSFHDMGLYDLPGCIDYILKFTGQTKLDYVGHSMGTTMFFVCMSERPEYNSKIRSMQAMAPVTYMAKIASPIKCIAPFADNINWIASMVGINWFSPSSELLVLMGQSTCYKDCPLRCICESYMFLMGGYDLNEINMEMIPVIMAHTAPSSTKTMVQYAELMNSKKFCYKDLGWWDNYWTYGQTTPPNYQLSKVSCPVTLHYSANDMLSSVPDVQTLYTGLTSCQKQMLPHPNSFCTHTGYLYAKDNAVLYERVAAIMQQY